MSNITVPNKSPGNQHTAAELNQQTGFINQPTKIGTTFTDTGAITVDETIEYSTIRTVTGSTHTLTAATSGNVQGNYKKVRYTFDVDCTLTLTDFDDWGSTVGTVNPIPAGTYDFWFFTTPWGVALIIQNNVGTTQSQLEQVTGFQANAGSEQVSLSWNAVQNATGYVLQRSTDQVNWVAVSGYNGTDTNYTDTGLNNGTTYYYQVSATAAGYIQSAFVSASATPQSGSQNLPQITGLTVITDNKYQELTLSWNAPSGNAVNLSVERSLDGVTGWAEAATPTANAVTDIDTGLTANTFYYYRVREIGDGVSFITGAYSSIVSNTTLNSVSDNFAGSTINTDKWLITNPNTEVAISQNESLIFTEDATAVTTGGADNVTSKLILGRQVISMQATIARGRDDSQLNTPFIGIYEDNLGSDNRIIIIPGGGTNNKQYARLVIYVGGVSQYDFTSTIDFDNTWKIEMDADGTIRIYYLSAPDTWTQVGTTQSTVMTDLDYVGFIAANSTTFDVNGDTVDFDTVYYQVGHYTTSTP